MNKTRLFIAVLMVAMVSIANAKPGLTFVKINGVNLECSDKNCTSAYVPEEHNATFLKGVYCGNIFELTDANVHVTEWKESKNYTVALLVARVPDVNTYYYLVTYKPNGGIIDGALVLCKDDIKITENTIERTRMSPRDHEFTLEENSATVTRNFESFVETGNGGPRISEEGKISMRYDIDKSGNITRPDDGITKHSIWTVEPNRSIPGARHDNIEVRESNECRTIGMGWNVILFYTQPASYEKISELFEGKLALFNNYFNADDRAVKNEASKCLYSLKDWQKRLMYRNSDPWLIWLNNNQKSNSLELLKQNLADDEVFNDWFKKEVKMLGNNKLKQSWNKILK